ncbi:hypothetical protein FBEOM_7163 [Fusarium beomiforme]|uniref:Nephrocystin 3-like N-terminal domain-containing protein n=1 Tax=Fusarium beomiforme TaxID=44412 RepID=A0A9P5AHV7_9HYPO|nr:hypothetical protein FBEOM_7163 [Fusarium beomiforme]
MDPVSAVGLASGILTFVEAGLKLVKIAYRIHSSFDGVLEDNRHREDVAGEVEKAALRLDVVGHARLTPEQESLSALAKKCKATSTDLVQVLNAVKPKRNSSNPFNSLRLSVKANKKTRHISDLDNQLKDYRDQLSLALVEFSRVEAADGFNQLISLAKGNEVKLQSLTQAMEHLRQGQLSSPNCQMPIEFQRFLMIDENARHSMYQDHILESLRFEEMGHRYEAVHNAHEDTFKWIYEPIEFIKKEGYLKYNERLINEARKLESQEKFVRWLSSEVPSSPIFHISGKLGSGKSTLMKFLCSHQKTKDMLMKWAGAKKLVFASFFFWRNGSKAQKSLDGLHRSILHDLLKQRPDLVPEIFPEQWNQVKQGPWRAQNRQQIPSVFIKKALERLFQNEHLYQQHKYCIFIDGLDEFEPGVQDGLDYIDLVNVLREWTIHANGNLKLCLSSREEGVFMDEYANDRSFRLQDLTRFDMRNYVRSRLGNLDDENLKSEFISAIPDRSSGIFLWTYLVVKAIRNKITHRVTSEALRKYLETLPQSLESLFHHILQQLEPDDMIKTLRIINFPRAAKSNYLELPLLTLSLMDDYARDSEFSLRDGLEDEPIPDEDVLQVQLRGTCGGLIECHKGTHYERRHILEFVHRSVPDMIHKDARNPELARQMGAALDDIDTIDVISQVCFAAFRLSGQKGTAHIERHAFCSITPMRLKSKIDKPPYSFLEYIGAWVDDRSLDSDQIKWFCFLGINPWGGIRAAKRYKSSVVADHGIRLLYNNMCLAASVGRTDYLEWKIENDTSAMNNSVKRALFGQSLLTSPCWEMFFRNSLFRMDSIIPLVPAVLGPDNLTNNGKDMDFWSLSSWQFFVAHVILTFSECRDENYPGNVVERFLR